MPSLWFIVPAHGRLSLTRICLEQLRRTCDALKGDGIEAHAVVVADDENLRTAWEFGFGTIERGNEFVSMKYNDGIQLACDPELTGEGVPECGLYQVVGKRDYRGHPQGSEFPARLDPRAERRAIDRGSIVRVGSLTPSPGKFSWPEGWEPRPVDYVVPCGSDDWVDWRLFTDLPAQDTMVGFQRLSFVRADGREMVQRFVNVRGGCGIRIYPRAIVGMLGYRPADEDRKRACDTSIITNLTKAARFQIEHRTIDPRQIVDWKSKDIQLNPYESLTFHRTFANPQDPFEALADLYPAEALAAMQRHYSSVREMVPA
jgi:hypothetical protein